MCTCIIYGKNGDILERCTTLKHFALEHVITLWRAGIAHRWEFVSTESAVSTL